MLQNILLLYNVVYKMLTHTVTNSTKVYSTSGKHTVTVYSHHCTESKKIATTSDTTNSCHWVATLHTPSSSEHPRAPLHSPWLSCQCQKRFEDIITSCPECHSWWGNDDRSLSRPETLTWYRRWSAGGSRLWGSPCPGGGQESAGEASQPPCRWR